MGRDKTIKKKIDTHNLDSLGTKIVYWVFQSLILLTSVASIILCIVNKEGREIQINHIFLCSVALILYNIPSFLKKKFHVYIPTVLQVFTLVFIFAHFILGEIQGVYNSSAIFDKILHTTSGLAIATIGFSLVNILNDSKNTHMKLSPLFVAVFAFCFALAVAVVWEIFEYAADSLFGTNMQRYDPPAGLVEDTIPRQGYGLIDSMNDIIVSTIAALVVCLLGFFSLKSKSNLLNRFLMRMVPDYDSAIEEATLAGDEKLVSSLMKAREQDSAAEIKDEDNVEESVGDVIVEEVADSDTVTLDADKKE